MRDSITLRPRTVDAIFEPERLKDYPPTKYDGWELKDGVVNYLAHKRRHAQETLAFLLPQWETEYMSSPWIYSPVNNDGVAVEDTHAHVPTLLEERFKESVMVVE